MKKRIRKGYWEAEWKQKPSLTVGLDLGWVPQVSLLRPGKAQTHPGHGGVKMRKPHDEFR
jgi:hypothetical protein